MSLRMMIFMFVMPVIWVLLHLYLGRRLLHGVEGRRRRLAWIGVAALAFLPVAAVMGSRLAGGDALRSLQWFGFLLMGISSILFVSVLVTDLVRVAAAGVRRVRKPAVQADPSRRSFMAKAVNLGILGSTGSITGVGVVQARRMPTVVETDVPIGGLPEALHGYRIAQISDIHVGPTIRGEFLRGVVELVNAQSPDLIAVTGDLIDGYVPDMTPEVASLADLKAPDGVFFVTGNHEYYWDGPAWCEHVASLGLTVLINEHRVIERGGASMLLAGVTDISAGGMVASHRSDPAKARHGAPECDVDVLLAHQPRSIDAAAEAGYDLQLSGHTHGGQYFPMNILVHLVQPYVAGLHRHADKTWIYVSRGTGYWGPPMRVGAPHEISVLRLVPA